MKNCTVKISLIYLSMHSFAVAKHSTLITLLHLKQHGPSHPTNYLNHPDKWSKRRTTYVYTRKIREIPISLEYNYKVSQSFQAQISISKQVIACKRIANWRRESLEP